MRLLVAATAMASADNAACGRRIDDSSARRMMAPDELLVACDVPSSLVARLLAPVEAFYGFWVNGSPALLRHALGWRALGYGRVPVREAARSMPTMLSSALLAAIPDLRMAMVQRLVHRDKVVSHLVFAGHFTGSFLGRHGRGQPVHFMASDVITLSKGRIRDVCHVEDSASLLAQIGVASVG